MQQDLHNKLKNRLQWGDQISITKRTGISKHTVNKFFTGQKVSKPTIKKIIQAMIDINQDRRREAKNLNQLINKI